MWFCGMYVRAFRITFIIIYISHKVRSETPCGDYESWLSSSVQHLFNRIDQILEHTLVVYAKAKLFLFKAPYHPLLSGIFCDDCVHKLSN